MNNKDFNEALKIINNLIDGISFLPISWDNMLTIEVSENVKEFMRKHDPENWAERDKPPVVNEK